MRLTPARRHALDVLAHTDRHHGSDAAAAILTWHDGLQVHCASCLHALGEDAVRLPSGEWWCCACHDATRDPGGTR